MAAFLGHLFFNRENKSFFFHLAESFYDKMEISGIPEEYYKKGKRKKIFSITNKLVKR